MVDCLGIGATAQRLGGGALVMWDRVYRLVAALEMLRQLRRNRVEPLAPGGFEPAADADMARRAPRRRQATVQQLAIEIVPERVEVCGRAIRPRVRRCLIDENASARQPCAGGLDRIDLALQRGRGGRGREFAADDALPAGSRQSRLASRHAAAPAP